MIKKFQQFNESNDDKTVDRSNFIELKDSIERFIASIGDGELFDELSKGYKFTIDNINDEDDQFSMDFVNLFFTKLNKAIKTHKNDFWDFTDKGYSGYKSVGSKYKEYQNFSNKDLAKVIRGQIRAKFPDWKISVVKNSNSINVYIKDLPYNPYSQEYISAREKGENFTETYHGAKMYTPQFEKDLKTIKKIGADYRMDDSDGMTDYFHTNFYYFVNVESDVLDKYIPNNPDAKRRKEWEEKYAAQQSKRKEVADQRKGKFKRGDKVIYVIDKDYGILPKGEYEGVIIKSPNGRGFSSNYSVKITVNALKNPDGTIRDLTKPREYEVNIPTSSPDTILRLNDK